MYWLHSVFFGARSNRTQRTCIKSQLGWLRRREGGTPWTKRKGRTISLRLALRLRYGTLLCPYIVLRLEDHISTPKRVLFFGQWRPASFECELKAHVQSTSILISDSPWTSPEGAGAGFCSVRVAQFMSSFVCAITWHAAPQCILAEL